MNCRVRHCSIWKNQSEEVGVLQVWSKADVPSGELQSESKYVSGEVHNEAESISQEVQN